jgi:hypothetical protein
VENGHIHSRRYPYQISPKSLVTEELLFEDGQTDIANAHKQETKVNDEFKILRKVGFAAVK